jgi:DNA-binding XRE family transcriptional regulator
LPAQICDFGLFIRARYGLQETIGEQMKKIHPSDYKALRTCLKEVRKKSGLTQIQLAEAIGADQSDISKIERGERRLDVVELVYICRALGITTEAFIAALEGHLEGDDQHV